MSNGNRLKDAKQKKEQARRSAEGAGEARSQASGDDDVRVNVRVDPGLHERFKARADREGRPLSWVIRRFMEHYADGGDVPPPPNA